MLTRYKLILSNKQIYKEIQLPIQGEPIWIGTDRKCDVRFQKEDFVETFGFQLKQDENGQWFVNELNNCMIEVPVFYNDRIELHHGDQCKVMTSRMENELFELTFLIDFDYENKIYDTVVDLADVKEFTIGTKSECNIILVDSYLKVDLLRIIHRQEGLDVYVTSSVEGVRKNGIEIKKTFNVCDTDFFSISNFSFYYKKNLLYVAESEHLAIQKLNYSKIKSSSSSLAYPCFNRSTQLEVTLCDEPIEILKPAEKPAKYDDNLLMAILPSLGSLILIVLLRGFMSGGGNIGYIAFSVCSMILGICVSIMNYNKRKKEYAVRLKEREDIYHSYIMRKRKEIVDARKEEIQLLNQRFPDIIQTFKFTDDFTGDLFNRSQKSKDYLKIRIGTGLKESKRKIQHKSGETLISADELEAMSDQLEKEFHMLKDVPIICDLKQSHNLGIVGTDEARYEFLKVLTLELAAHHYFKEVKIFYVFHELRAKQLSWVRFLPHVQNDDLAIRNIVCDEASKTVLYEYLYKELCRRESMGKQISDLQELIIFLVDDIGIKNHPISRYFEKASELHVHFITFEQYQEQLPMFCGHIIVLKDGFKGTLIESSNSQQATEFSFPVIENEKIKQFAIRIAPVYCEEINLESDLTSNITLFEMLGIIAADDLDLENRWKMMDICNTMAAPIGVKLKNEPIYLDLHENAHGPHGLVAGTTGSGKSEILQTYILSMASLYSPLEVGFLLIDFKGGGMANQFRNLPHLRGAITDIDGKKIVRSLLSIRAELNRRKNLFSIADVNSIKQYIQKCRKNPEMVSLPHLIIIVDEFAELKAEHPEFMKELISTARIGRSLGVHLILATQKPAGQVNEQIWSNSRFKLCLKVQTREDSNEVLKSPLAAEIREPGRAYLQVGNNEIFELFQSAYSGAPEKTIEAHIINKEFTISRVALSGKRTVIYQQKKEQTQKNNRTQLEAIVQYVKNYCNQINLAPVPAICLPSLSQQISYPVGREKGRNSQQIEVEIGIYDAPDMQYQGSYNLKISNHNTVIIGAAQYGKTNLLQVIIRSLAENYTPEEVNIYILDFASMFLKNYENLPHVGGVVCASDEERFKNLFKMLAEEIEKRKEKILAAGVSSFSAYREAGFVDMTQIVLIVDNYTGLKETYFNDEDLLFPICRDGNSVGINVIISNSIVSGFGYKCLSTMSNHIAFHCNDGDDVSTLFGFTKMRPDSVPGRCLVSVDKAIYEAQIYQAFKGEREIDCSRQIGVFVQDMQTYYPNQKAMRIPCVPDKLSSDLLYKMAEDNMCKNAIGIGIDYESIEPVWLSLDTQFMISLVGVTQQRQEKFINCLLLDIQKYIFERKVNLYIVDGVSKICKKYRDMPFVERYTTHAEELIDYIQYLETILEERSEILEISENKDLEQMPLEMVLVNNRKSLEILSNSKENMKVFDRILKQFRHLKVMFIFTDVDNVSVGFSTPEMMKRIRDEKKSFIFTSLKEVKLHDISGQMVRKYSTAPNRVDAYYLDGESVRRVKLVE